MNKPRPSCASAMAAVFARPRGEIARAPFGGFDAGLHAGCALRRVLSDVAQSTLEITEGRKRVSNFHRRCFAQTGHTCSSVANSRRATAARERVTAGFFLGRQGDRRLGFPGELKKDTSEVVLHFERQGARRLKSVLEQFGMTPILS